MIEDDGVLMREDYAPAPLWLQVARHPAHCINTLGGFAIIMLVHLCGIFCSARSSYVSGLMENNSTS